MSGSAAYFFVDHAALLVASTAWCADADAAAATYGHVSTWDVSNVTDLSNVFCGLAGYCQPSPGCYNFNEDISSWDTSSVTSLHVRATHAHLA